MGGKEGYYAAGNIILASVDNRFVMIPKSYSDGLVITREGPAITRSFSSERRFDYCERSYRTGAKFVSKLVPRRFLTTLTVATDDDELTRYCYCECIAFERRTVAKQHSETTNIFLPKEAIAGGNYRSTLRFEPNAKTLRYSASLEVLPARKTVVILEEESGPDTDATEWVEKKVANGGDASQQLNGEVL